MLEALGRSPLFIAAALPLKIFPPLFNRYEGGEAFGTHIDNAVRIHRGSEFRVRTDLSATLFLEEPDSYEGGELVIEDSGAGAQPVKLPAGHLLLYPASSLHRVEPVTSGARVASFFWVQSMVRDDGARAILFDLDRLDPGDRRRPRPGRSGGDPADRGLSQSAQALGRQLRRMRR